MALTANPGGKDQAPQSPALLEALAVARTLLADAVTPEVVRALRDAGVRPILLKGPAIARWLYEDDGRTYCDTDILVDPAQIEQAERVLSQLGFKLSARDALGALADAPLDAISLDRPWHAHAWLRGVGSVDLHRTLVGVGVSYRELWQVLSDRTETTLVGGVEVEILDPPARALHIALHAAQDSKLTSRRDLPRALARLPTSIWEEAGDLAARLEAVPAFGAGLRLLPAGETLAAHLGLPKRRSVEIALRAGAAPRMALVFDWLMNTPGMRTKLTFVAHTLVPSVAFMRAWSPLARRGLLGLVAAYLWRPVWLCGNAAPALGAWWRTRRELG